MRRLISATLALSLLGATAAAAAPYDHGSRNYDRGYSNQDYNGGYGNRYQRDNYRGRGDSNGAAIFAGVGILALAAILASQNHHHYHQGWHNHDGGRYGNGYDRGYGYNYGDRNDRYGDEARRW